MGDGEVVKLRMAQQAGRAAGRAGPGAGGRPMAAVAAESVHPTIIGPVARREKAICPRPSRR